MIEVCNNQDFRRKAAILYTTEINGLSNSLWYADPINGVLFPNKPQEGIVVTVNTLFRPTEFERKKLHFSRNFEQAIQVALSSFRKILVKVCADLAFRQQAAQAYVSTTEEIYYANPVEGYLVKRLFPPDPWEPQTEIPLDLLFEQSNKIIKLKSINMDAAVKTALMSFKEWV